jgi:ergothioneine biosynthesis protein EgtB
MKASQGIVTPVEEAEVAGGPARFSDTATTWADSYRRVRQASARICAPLQVEDYVVQTMDDVSPPKWNLAHTTWFFEEFLLRPFLPGYQVFHQAYGYLFNSYYEAVGERHPRPQRGLLSRPTVEEVYAYRDHVDRHMLELIAGIPEARRDEIEALLLLGCNHEQQHQELLLTDLKHILAANPLRPVYQATPEIAGSAASVRWISHPGGLVEIGHEGPAFSYDNEGPRHQVYLRPFQLASRLVTNGEFLAFMEAGGYKEPACWLSEGWATVRQQGWESPLYWERSGSRWWMMTLSGFREVVEHEPVCHVSYFEADAYARWKGKRLATEAEWEVAAVELPVEGNFLDQGRLHPIAAPAAGTGLAQMFGDVWEWTQSPYTPYPGFKTLPGAVGEYNGKFMCNQYVLRGGSCATPANHIRVTYRNFFPPQARWQFSGIRLAEDGR